MNGSIRNKEVNWSVIPFARASHTVKRHCELQLANEANDENHLPLEGGRPPSNRMASDGIQMEDTRMDPFGLNSKVIKRLDTEAVPGSSSFKQLQIVTSKENLPHPSKLRKRKSRSSSSLRRTGHRQKHGVDVVAHIAQLKRKQAEFKWLSPFASQFEEELFPLSRGASRELQKVPSSPDMRHYVNTVLHNKCYSDTGSTPESSLKEFQAEENELLHDCQPRSLWQQASPNISKDKQGHNKVGNADFQFRFDNSQTSKYTNMYGLTQGSPQLGRQFYLPTFIGDDDYDLLQDPFIKRKREI